MGPLWKRFNPPGTAPGTISTEAENGEGVVLSLVTYDAQDLEIRADVSVDDAAAARGKGHRTWLRVVGRDPATFAHLRDVFSIHPLTLEDVWNTGQRPKVEEHPGYVFTIVQVLKACDGGGIEEEQVSVLLFDDILITVEQRENRLFSPIEARLESRGRIRDLGLDYLAYAVIDTVIDYLFPVLDGISARLEEAEDRLLDDPGPDNLEVLHGLKRDLLRVRRVAWPSRELTSSLARIENPLVGKDVHPYLRDVYDHAVQCLEIAESFRDMANGLVELHLSTLSNRMNEVMKTLTIIATLFIPLTFIAGLYGMNFDTRASRWNMPELGWAFGYPAVLLLMLGVAVWMIFFFKRKRWL